MNAPASPQAPATQAPSAWTVTRTIPADHPAFDGHFPGRPLLPGVALVAEAMEALLAVPALAARVGAEPRLSVAKFLSPVEPGASIELTLRDTGSGVEFVVRDGPSRIAARGVFEAAERAS